MNKQLDENTPQTAKVVKKKFDIQRLIFIIVFLAMPTLHFLIFYVYVNIDSFLMAFQRVEYGQLKWGLMNFKDFFEDLASDNGQIKLGIINALKTWLVQFTLLPISFLVSVFIYRKIPGANTFRIIFYLPGLLSATIVSSLYIKLCNNTGYGTDTSSVGLLSTMVQKLFNLEAAPALLGEERWANTFVFINIIWLSFPGDMIIWGGTLSRIPDSVIESAKLDGASWWQETIRIIIPMVWPVVALKLVLMTTAVFGASGNVFLLTNKGDYGTQTLSNWMYLQIYNQGGYIKNSNALYYLSAVGLVITLATAVLVVIVQWVTKKMDTEVTF